MPLRRKGKRCFTRRAQGSAISESKSLVKYNLPNAYEHEEKEVIRFASSLAPCRPATHFYKRCLTPERMLPITFNPLWFLSKSTSLSGRVRLMMSNVSGEPLLFHFHFHLQLEVTYPSSLSGCLQLHHRTFHRRCLMDLKL